MLIYYIILAFILLFAYPMCMYKPSVLKKRVYVLSVFTILYIVASFRYGTGNDYFNYMEIYDYYLKSTDFNEAFKIVIEPAFSLLNWTLSRFTDDIIFVNSVYSFIILTPVAYVIMARSDNVWVSCYLYICLTFYYTTLNFTRQSMAASFIFLAFFFYEKRKYIFSVLFVIVSILFHATAIIFIPIFLLCLIRPEKYLYTAYIALITICYFAVDILFDLAANLMSLLINPRYSAYIGSRYTQSLGWHFVLIPVLSFIIIYFVYNAGWHKKERSAALFTNLAFFSAVIWLFITKIMILERLSMYFYIFIILSVPSAVNYLLGDINTTGARFISDVLNIDSDDYNERRLKNTAYEQHEQHEQQSQKYKLTFFSITGLYKKIPEQLSSVKENKYNTRKKLSHTKRIKNKFIISKKICFCVFGIYMFSCLIYHSYGLVASSKGFHGVNPYRSGIAGIERIITELSGRSKLNLLFDANGIYNYLLLLTGKDCTVIISGQPSTNPYLDSVTRATLNNMGIKYNFENMRSDCLITIIKNGVNIYENDGTERLEYSTELFEKEINIISDIEQTSILIDEEQCSLGHTGLNIVVLDNYGEIISKASITNNQYGKVVARFKPVSTD